MKRLTGIDELGYYMPLDVTLNCLKHRGECVDRLGAYEDTGLSPGEIVRMGMMFEDSKRYSGRLEMKLKSYLDIGLKPAELTALKLASMGKCVAEIKEFDGISIDRLRELAKADNDERLVLLPCKPLDTVYSLFCGEIVEKRIGAITINGYTNPRIWVELYCDFLATQTERWDLAVGKEFFLTRGEAEAALKGDAE